jgi:hypothetical protein
MKQCSPRARLATKEKSRIDRMAMGPTLTLHKQADSLSEEEEEEEEENDDL